jgi:hypothetical protein
VNTKLKIVTSSIFLSLLAQIILAEPPTTVWYKIIGGKYEDMPLAVFQTNPNDYLMTGYTRSFSGDIKGTYMATKVYLAKFNEKGDILSELAYGADSTTRLPSVSIQLSNGEILVAGSIRPNVFEWQPLQIFMSYFNSNGLFLREFTFGITNSTNKFLKNKVNDMDYLMVSYNVVSCKETSDGDIMLAGIVNFHLPKKAVEAKDNQLAEMSKSCVYLARVSSNGLVKWEKIYSYSLSDFPIDMTLINKNEILMIGNSINKKTYKPGESVDKYPFFRKPFITKFDVSGKQKSISYLEDETQDDNKDIYITNDGSIFISETSSFNLYLANVTASFDTIWKQTFIYPDNTILKIISDDKGYYLLNNQSTDVNIIRTDKNGTELWATKFGGYSFDSGKDILPLDDGFIFAGSSKSYMKYGGFDFWLMLFR